EHVLHELERSLDALDAIADAATSPDRERIWQLKNRLRPIQSNSPSFQTQLLELVEQVELPDAAWLRDFKFRARRTAPPLGWAAAAQAYRAGFSTPLSSTSTSSKSTTRCRSSRTCPTYLSGWSSTWSVSTVSTN